MDKLTKFKSLLPKLKSFLCSYYNLTLIYVFIVCSLAGICISFIERDFSQTSMIDGIFLCISAGSGAGLSTIDTNFLKTTSKFLVSVCMTACGVAFAGVCVPAIIRCHRLLEIKKQAEKDMVDNEEFTSASTSSDENDVVIDFHTSEISPYKYNYAIEHQAVKLFSVIAIMYTIVPQLIAFTIIIISVYTDEFTYRQITAGGTSPLFFSYFTTVSAWNNAGLVIHASTFQFTSNSVIITTVSVLSILGNCGIPIGIRYTTFLLHRLTEQRDTKVMSPQFPYLYILKSPTRISAYLFSSTQTKLLVVIFILLLFLQSLAFVLFNRDDLIETPLILGLLQASVTRTAGFQYITSFSELHDVVNLIYIFTMFVGSYPIQMIRDYRDTQVSLQSGYLPDRMNVRTILTYFSDVIFSHSMIVFFFTIIVMAIYSLNSPNEHSALTVLFEVTSAFGTVGYSLGYKDYPYSFSGGLCLLGKICIIVCMLLGRVRGFPDQLYPNDYYKEKDV
ncbi:cation transporter [Entamoeba marina]